MTLGQKDKDGVIIKCKDGFKYYYGMNDHGLRPVMKEDSKKGHIVKTMKTHEVVEIANNKYTVIVYPNGDVSMIPNDQ